MNTSIKLLVGLTVAGAAILTSCSADHPAPVADPSQAQVVAVPRGGWGAGPERGRGPGWDQPGPMAGHPHMLCSYEPGTALTDRVVTGLREALLDEWRSEMLYDELGRNVGRPFPRLERSEERHADAIVRLLDAHGQLPPQRPFAPSTDVTSPVQACAIALDNERANVAMYDRLIADDPPGDVKCVYEHLRTMSTERHIPALERWCKGAIR